MPMFRMACKLHALPCCVNPPRFVLLKNLIGPFFVVTNAF